MVAGLSATETRVATMGGDIDLLINDEQNVYMYPSSLFRFGKLATLEFGNLPSWNRGSYPAGMLITHNDKMAIGLLGNRPIYTTNHPTDPMMVNAYGIIFGMGMENLNIGVQMNMGIKGMSYTPNKDTTYSYSTMFIGIIPGITFKNGNMGIDASLNMTIQNWKDEGYSSVTDTLKFAGTPNIGLNVRFFTGSMTKKIIGAFHFNFYKDAYSQDTTTFNNGTTTNIEAKIGEYLHPIRNINILGGINLNFSNLSTSDTTGTTTINSGIILGGEALVSSRLGFRIGILRDVFTFSKSKNGSTSSSSMGFADAPVNASIGAFLNFESVRIDASISNDLLFNGPYFLTGTPSNLAGTISAILNF